MVQDEQTSVEDEQWMRRALVLAEQAQAEGEVPVGAIVVRDGKVLGEGWNSTIGKTDPSAHAELCAIRAAALFIDNYRLPGTSLYVTLEPCAMCVGAIIHARIERLVFAAAEPRAGAVHSQLPLLDQEYFNHRVQWRGGVLGDQSSALLKSFFRRKREAKSKSGST